MGARQFVRSHLRGENFKLNCSTACSFPCHSKMMSSIIYTPEELASGYQKIRSVKSSYSSLAFNRDWPVVAPIIRGMSSRAVRSGPVFMDPHRSSIAYSHLVDTLRLSSKVSLTSVVYELEFYGEFM